MLYYLFWRFHRYPTNHHPPTGMIWKLCHREWIWYYCHEIIFNNNNNNMLYNNSSVVRIERHIIRRHYICITRTSSVWTAAFRSKILVLLSKHQSVPGTGYLHKKEPIDTYRSTYTDYTDQFKFIISRRRKKKWYLLANRNRVFA